MSEKDVTSKVRIQKRKAAGVAIGLFGAFVLLFPNVISTSHQNTILYIIEAVGATGVVDWIVKDRKTIKAWVQKLFKRKGKGIENGKEKNHFDDRT